MESYLLWGYFHIILFVFWLGGDIGVFLSAIYAKRSDLSFETRSTVMQLGLVIDFLPRLCFALIFPVGLHLTNDLGLIKIDLSYFFLSWFISFVWISMIILIGKNEGKPIAEKLSKIQLDVFPFGGCNSSLECLSLDIPVITQPSKILNGRFTAGFYKKMNITDLICKNKKSYLHMVKKLLSNKNYYNNIKDNIRKKKIKLFEEYKSFEDWKNFLKK